MHTCRRNSCLLEECEPEPYDLFPQRLKLLSLTFDPLADQQLGGLIMWIPSGLVYVLAGLALASRWLKAPTVSELRVVGER